MPNVRWKWMRYYIYSNAIVVACVTGLAILLFPEKLSAISKSNTLLFAFLSLLLSIILGVVCGFAFSKNLRGRLEDISIGVRNLSYGNLKHRLPFTDDRELGDIAIGFNEMTERIEKQVASLQKLAQENEELLQQAKNTAISEERQRLARELHDAVSQQLFAISLTSATALKVIQTKPERCHQLLETIEESAVKAQSEMRALLLQLRPITLENEKLTSAIQSLARELETKQSLQCELILDETPILPAIENHLYRVVQEGLSNVLRHSAATQVKISLDVSAEKRRVLLSIEDNGKGFDPETIAKKTSYGLNSIRERIALLGGTVQWLSLPAKGTRMEIRIPLVGEI